MRILLIHPQARVHRHEIGLYGKGLRYAPITMPVLAALVPDRLNADIKVVDEMIEPVDFDDPADIVGITCITGTACRAYEIADVFRKKGRTVVIGGVHASLLPDEAAAHADAVVVGYAEETWPILLEDYTRGQLKAIYQSHTPPGRYVPPLRKYIGRSQYIAPNTIELFRGCGNKCKFCSSSVLFPSPIARDIEDVILEIETLPGKMLTFLDPNLITDLAVAREFFLRLVPLKKWWVGCTTIDVYKDPGMLELFKKSGCKGLLIGLESVRQEALDSIDKSSNNVADYQKAMAMIHDSGISIQGCFVLGFDSDDKDVFEETFNFVQDTGIDYVHYTLLTPFPGTPLYWRYENMGRIITKDWSLYNGRNVVLQPAQMTIEELQAGYRELWKRTYSGKAILTRLSRSPGLNKIFALISNIQARRLQQQAVKQSL